MIEFPMRKSHIPKHKKKGETSPIGDNSLILSSVKSWLFFKHNNYTEPINNPQNSLYLMSVSWAKALNKTKFIDQM